MSRYQKGKTNLDFTEARDSEWQWHQLGRMRQSASRSRQITTPAPHRSVIYRPDALPAAQPTASLKALAQSDCDEIFFHVYARLAFSAVLSILDEATQVRRRRGTADFERQQSHFVVDPLLNGQPV